MNGMAPKKENEEVNKPKSCNRCDTINAWDSKHCSKCGGVLDLAVALAIDENDQKRGKANHLMSLLLQDKQIQEIISCKLQGLGVNQL